MILAIIVVLVILFVAICRAIGASGLSTHASSCHILQRHSEPVFDRPQAIAVLFLEAGRVIPTLACLLLSVSLALHALYGEGSQLLEGLDDADEASPLIEGFRTFGSSIGTVLAAALGEVPATGGADIP